MLEPLSQQLSDLRHIFASDRYPSALRRRQWLDGLEALINEQGEALCQAVAQDFGCRSADETRLIELLPAVAAIRHARAHLKSWMKSKRRPVSLLFQPARARVHYQPLGVVGIIVPWNYPIYLAFGPMVAALAAGNRVLIKMSESTPVLGELLARLIGQYLPPGLVGVVNGDIEVARAFSALDFDHLLFTGSTATGRQVMSAAAKNLTPVTLELGGKSPTIIADDYDLKKAAGRICTAKLLNAGQTCVAPDYILIGRGRSDEFVQQMQRVARELYPAGFGGDYTSVINAAHYARLQALIAELEQHSTAVVELFEAADDPASRHLVPRIVLNPDLSLGVMQQEIFGPLLPVVEVADLAGAIEWINARERPLALYLFSNDRNAIKCVLRETCSGGVAINECMLQVAQDNLPFGGIGPSGMGQYHGHDGFLTFSKARGVFYQARYDGLPLLRPPYGGFGRKLLNFLLRWAR